MTCLCWSLARALVSNSVFAHNPPGNLWVLTFALSNQYHKVLKTCGKAGKNVKNTNWIHTLAFMNACYAVVRVIECFTLTPTLADNKTRRPPGFRLMQQIDHANTLNPKQRKGNENDKWNALIAPLMKLISGDSGLNYIKLRPYNASGLPLIEATMLINIARMNKHPPEDIYFRSGKLTGIGTKDTNYFTVNGTQITAVDQLVLISCRGFIALDHECCLYFKQRVEDWLSDDDRAFINESYATHASLQNDLTIDFLYDDELEPPEEPDKAKAPQRKKASPHKVSKTTKKQQHKPISRWSVEAMDALTHVNWSDEETFQGDELAKNINNLMKEAFDDDTKRQQIFERLQLITPKHLTKKLNAEKDWYPLFQSRNDRAKLHTFQARLRNAPGTGIKELEKWQTCDKAWVRLLVDPNETVPIEIEV